MKYLTIFFVCLFYIGQAKGEIHARLDSIRIMGFDRNIEFVSDLTRSDFIEYIQHQKFENRPEYINLVDTLISESCEIDSLLMEMSHLYIIDTLSYSTSQLNAEIVYSLADKGIRWYERYKSDYRLVMLLFFQGEVELVWLDIFCLERSFFRYRLSKHFLLLLRKYTHLYDDAIVYYVTEDI